MNTDDKASVLIQTVTIIAVTGVANIILNSPDISAAECCNRACVFSCVAEAPLKTPEYNSHQLDISVSNSSS